MDSLILIFVLSFAPGIFWLWFFYRKDEWELEPIYLIGFTFFMGMLSTIPAYFAETWFDSFVVRTWANPILGGLISAILGAPIVEETCKFLAARLTVYRLWEFDEPIDGIVYAAAAALGFASVENFAYVFNAHRSAELQDIAWGVSVGRALLSVPGHVLDSSVWGYWLGRVKFISMNDPAHSIKLMLGGLLGAMVLHGAFNFLALGSALAPYFLLIGPLFLLGFFGLVRLSWTITNTLTATALADSPYNPLNMSAARYRSKFFELLERQPDQINATLEKLWPEVTVIAPESSDFDKLIEKFSPETRAAQFPQLSLTNHSAITDNSLKLVPTRLSEREMKLYIPEGAPANLRHVLQKLNPAIAFLGLVQMKGALSPATVESGWHRTKTNLHVALYDDQNKIIQLYTVSKKAVRYACEEALLQMREENIRRGLAKATGLQGFGSSYVLGHLAMPEHRVVLAAVVLVAIAAKINKEAS